ncbi:hypothetical protein EIP91_005241 [Steccherinum ochraceum]|uniref:FH2 domain-containing protein n=1 Tax=Steccherinum ochraceum TaxID=92696 RepID=A0A4R0RMY3_9APHY|nr:hypothetical protein EIP91_005241 [Steccherinum ochraceum]
MGGPPPPPPLPPGIPGAPPPPPPPPSVSRPIVKVSAKQTTKRLKPFFWNKLQAPTTTSVWNDKVPSLSVDLKDLESMFAIDAQPSTSSKMSVTSPKKQNVTTLLDITRANNVAIMLSRIKLSLPDIRRALLELDDIKLSTDDLKAIGKQLPTTEEIARITDFEDVGKLAKADQYFSHIMTIPRLSERLECMLYRRKLEIEIEEVRPELNIVRNASHELRASVRFKQVLQTVLAVGNALNGSSFRGNARGFQLDALLKLKETKTAKGGADCPTLLHYVAKVLLRSDPVLVTFIEDTPHLEAAARVSVPTVMQTIQSLVNGLSTVKEELVRAQKDPLSQGDRFVSVMQPFILVSGPTVDAIKKMSLSLDAELKSLLTFYGEMAEGPEATKPEDFFSMILSFSSSLQKAALEVHDAEVKSGKGAPKISVEEAEAPTEPTVKGKQATSENTLKPPPDSQGRAAGRDPSDR